MSVPTSLRVGPFTSTVLAKKRYILFYLFLFWISLISILIEFYFIWQITNPWKNEIYFYLFLVPIILILYISWTLISLLYAKVILVIINFIHKPREGVFLRDSSDKDYRYWSMRNTIKRWPVWLAHKFPLPFMDNICFKVFGVKTKLKNSLFEGWVDCEFMEFGENVIVGQASIIQSSLIIGNLLIIRKSIIKDNARIGAHTVVMPGTIIQKNVILGSNSITTVGQVLEEGWIYLGAPANKFKKNCFFDDDLEDNIGHVEDIKSLRDSYEKKYFKWYDDDISWKERIHVVKEKKEKEKLRKIQGEKVKNVNK